MQISFGTHVFVDGSPVEGVIAVIRIMLVAIAAEDETVGLLVRSGNPQGVNAKVFEVVGIDFLGDTLMLISILYTFVFQRIVALC